MTSRPAAALVLLALCGCSSAPARPEGTVRYVGSSTVGIFIEAAEAKYEAIRFELDTEPESDGGERAVLESSADLGGIARRPSAAALRSGVVATLIGRDAIAVIVNARIPLGNLSSATLREIFSGRIDNWSDVGGPDLPIEPFIVRAGSATREVFRETILGGDDYADCREVRPDAAMIESVANAPGGIGQLSFSFLEGAAGIRTLSIDGEAASVDNFDYPISRPLYLLWREGSPVVEAFVDWTQGDDGQRVVMQRFVGIRVVGSVQKSSAEATDGTLVVYTETYPYYDGGIYYYPHRSYEILTREGELIRRVPNHRGENDEAPMRVRLDPGTYLIRAESERAERPEFFVTVESGELTELDIPKLLRQ